jgi:hypothetical protein
MNKIKEFFDFNPKDYLEVQEEKEKNKPTKTKLLKNFLMKIESVMLNMDEEELENIDTESFKKFKDSIHSLNK